MKNPAAWLLLFYVVPLVVLAWGADALATLLLMGLSRYRELVADRGAALLTGRPESLMSALQTISDRISAIPQTDLRATAGLNPFLVMPANRVSDGFDLDPFVLFPTHPTLSCRIERLSGIARTLAHQASTGRFGRNGYSFPTRSQTTTTTHTTGTRKRPP